MQKIPTHVYADLAAIVGEENISDDPAFLASHDWHDLGGTPLVLQGKLPGAVIMPGSTEEVAAVVKACNRHGLPFKAHSTGFGGASGVATAGSLAVDLRRMNRLEIDAENRMAIIEPYVTAGELLAEAMRHNLMCHIIGAGPIHSPLASAAAFMGVGVPGNHTGNNARNLLSLEWVTPEGEIVRIGSSASEAGWFTGDGPGPGFRGMIRGITGTSGGLGIFTRIGYKLYPWAGPAKLEWTGQHPERGVRLPENFSFHQLDWPTFEAMTEATQKLTAARVPMIITRTPPVGVGMMITPTNRAYYEAKAGGTLPPIARKDGECGWSVILMGWSPAELAWKQGVLGDVLRATGGRELAIAEEHRELLAANLLTSIYVARFLRMGSSATISLGVVDSIDLLPKLMRQTDELIGDQSKPGGPFLEADTEQNWMWLSEGRHLWSENNPVVRRDNPRSFGAGVYFLLRSFFQSEKDSVGLAAFMQGEGADLFGPSHGNVQNWMRRTKTLFDPRNLSDSPTYTRVEPPKEARIFPVAKRILFHPWFAPVFRRMLSKPR
ncbi:MAG: FAD-binding oxidoreductase [Novosphingobium sp.]